MEVAISGTAFLSLYWIHHLQTRYGNRLASATPYDPASPRPAGSLVYITGEVAPVVPGRTLTCGTPSIPCVLYLSETKQHISKMFRRFYGGYTWKETTESIGKIFRSLPFFINDPETQRPIVRIGQLSTPPVDLGLLTVSESYAPASSTAYIGGGRNLLGTSTLEKGLPSGTTVTAIGELVSHVGAKEMATTTTATAAATTTTAASSSLPELRIEQSPSAWPGVLTRESFGQLIKRKKQEARYVRYLVLLSLGVFLGLAAWRGYRMWRGRKVVAARRRRRSLHHCAGCGEGDRSIRCVPCGHRCLCEACALETPNECPACGAKVDFFSA
ncbi:hypothetical protein BJ684DRAFT_20283 [Piptocephalis cylindrospora]|uniref:RING-type E3 ubiquitin transferase n=1 Tax=Piptocephalis cylindrospora TaxID=1907219 RepID=A0A4P9Y5W7_9FUNG|nr:hypothetical protein BJ684DRAFT_20283 [Piptocephalis cylindrospora]|eukprot:RKP13210.1 hypothetical protein BJ684DRAFT_20283 [Piptocephalis cylindrospora]